MTELSELLPDWQIHLRAANKRPATVQSYITVGNSFVTFLTEQGYPTDASELRTPHVERFMAALHERVSPATVGKHYRSLQQFVKWMVGEGEAQDVMERMRPPAIPDQPVPILSDEAIKKLLKTCDSRDFTDRRDEAIMRMLLDTGMRASELIGLTIEDVDRDQSVAYVEGKGGRGRACPFGSKTAEAVSRYLRARARLPLASRSTALWLGTKGPLTDSGLRQLLERRALEAGVPGVHPHRFRHTFAHLWLSDGGQEQDLMQLAGWRSREMVGRYGSSAAAARARQAHKRLSPGDKF